MFRIFFLKDLFSFFECFKLQYVVYGTIICEHITGFERNYWKGAMFYGAETNQGFFWHYFVKKQPSKFKVVELNSFIYNAGQFRPDIPWGEDMLTKIVIFHFTSCGKPPMPKYLQGIPKLKITSVQKKLCVYFHKLWLQMMR